MRCIAWTVVALAFTALTNGADADVVDSFTDFKVKFGKKYSTPEEEAKRFRVFNSNMETAKKMASANPHATFGANAFSDLTATEFKSRHNADAYYKKQIGEAAQAGKTTMSVEAKTKAAGNKVDWRQHGAVTPIKNQGQCGSCWSFSTTGGIEGQWFLGGHPLVSLSEQFFVSCDTIDQGCKGGLMENAYEWVLKNKNGSLVTESSYPYVSGGGDVPACNATGTQFGAQITGYESIANNEDDMAAWVLTHGPLSIGVDATSWQMYTGGIITNCMPLSVDHGVLIVGFDDASTPPYWIVKNSWGPDWGEQGYIRVKKGNDQCLISSYPCSAKVKSVGPTPPPAPTKLPEPTPPNGPTQAPKPFPKGWVNLISPPYANAPQIVLALSCLSGNSCIVPGGSNGAGFSVFDFDGQRNGFFGPIQLANESGMAMFMAVGVGGTEDKPHGVVGGMDFGATPQYFVAKDKLAASLAIPFVVSQSISADRATGMNVLMQDGFAGGLALWFSTNGGETFTTFNASAPVDAPNCTAINSQHIVDAQTWFVTLGSSSDPNSNSGSASGHSGSSFDSPMDSIFGDDVVVLKRKSWHHAIVREKASGKVRHAFVDMRKYLADQKTRPLKETGCPFNAAIMKTSDGGKTWATVFQAENQGFMMDFIDCASPTHCVAVGAGFNMSHTPGSHVYLTTDGKTFTQTLHIPSNASMAVGISGVQFVPGKPNEIWLAGSVQMQNGGYATFWQSLDGGKTWFQHQEINFVMAITDLSFANDGVGFASGLTAMQDSTIMRYTPEGPAITPAPSYGGNFTQTICPSTGDCTGTCQTSSFPQNTCLNMTGGGSGKAICDMQDGVLIMQVYPIDQVCWGPYEEQMTPIDTCLVSQQGTFKVSCGGANLDEVIVDAPFKVMKAPRN